MIKYMKDLTVENVRLTPKGIERFTWMLQWIERKGNTSICPEWNLSLIDHELDLSGLGCCCNICLHFFPIIEGDISCPCLRYLKVIDIDEITKFLQTIVYNNKGD